MSSRLKVCQQAGGAAISRLRSSTLSLKNGLTINWEHPRYLWMPFICVPVKMQPAPSEFIRKESVLSMPTNRSAPSPPPLPENSKQTQLCLAL